MRYGIRESNQVSSSESSLSYSISLLPWNAAYENPQDISEINVNIFPQIEDLPAVRRRKDSKSIFVRFMMREESEAIQTAPISIFQQFLYSTVFFSVRYQPVGQGTETGTLTSDIREVQLESKFNDAGNPSGASNSRRF